MANMVALNSQNPSLYSSQVRATGHTHSHGTHPPSLLFSGNLGQGFVTENHPYPLPEPPASPGLVFQKRLEEEVPVMAVKSYCGSDLCS